MLKFTLKLTGVIGLIGAIAAPAFANDIPKKSPVGRYANLWGNSPFTEKPPPPDPEDPVSELDDYTLAGVSPVKGGFSVILINKKKRDERVHLMPGMSNEHGFKVDSVRQDPISPMNTKVKILMADGKSDWVGKEEKFLALKASPVTKPAAGKKPPTTNKPTGAQQVPGLNPAAKPTAQKAPRVRRVPTPPKK